MGGNVNIKLKVIPHKVCNVKKNQRRNKTWWFPVSLREKYFHSTLIFAVRSWGGIYDSKEEKEKQQDKLLMYIHAHTNHKWIYFHVVVFSIYKALNLYSIMDFFSFYCNVVVKAGEEIIYCPWSLTSLDEYFLGNEEIHPK